MEALEAPNGQGRCQDLRTEALDALKTFHQQKGLPKGGKTKIGPEAGKLLVENPVGNGVAVEAQ